MSKPHFLAHSVKDTVGVIVVEDVTAGMELAGVITDDNSDISVKCNHDIPIGHKVALVDIKEGDTIFKYGQDIGKAIADIGQGDHLHVHNVKTKRW